MVKVHFHSSFRKEFGKIKNKAAQEKILKQLGKLGVNPLIGKPMRYSRKGTREIYIAPYRLAYRYLEKEDLIEIIAFYHKDEQ